MRLRSNIFTVILLLITISAPAAFGWDDAGHKTTAYIAWQQMTPETRAAVINILLDAPEDSQLATFFANYGSRSLESRQLDFFMTAATWPDIVRDKRFKVRAEKYHNSSWHYSDTFWKWEDGKAVPVTDLAPNGLALQKLKDFSEVIRSSAASSADKALAIAWLEHIIGDIPQPLHASGRVTNSSPKGDQGGNRFLLTPKGTPRAEELNLHWFWDSILMRYEPNTKDVCDSDYLDPIGDRIMKMYPYDKMKGELAADNFSQWAKESLEISQQEVYRGVRFFSLPSDGYKKKAFEISEKRLALAGYRMAALFNEVFAKPSPAPPK